MKYWKGRWLIGVSLLHLLFVLVVYGNVIRSMVQHGLVKSVTNTTTAAVAWILLFGVLLFICGLAIASIERNASGVVPKAIGLGLFVVAVLAVVLMPASGAWLIFPPAIAILIQKTTSTTVATS